MAVSAVARPPALLPVSGIRTIFLQDQALGT